MFRTKSSHYETLDHSVQLEAPKGCGDKGQQRTPLRSQDSPTSWTGLRVLCLEATEPRVQAVHGAIHGAVHRARKEEMSPSPG